jgi:hypothetical protein
VVAETAKPIALVAAYGSRQLDRILRAIADGPDPPIADWFVGTYGINGRDAARITAVRGCHYAPVFCIQPNTSMKIRMMRPMARRRFGEAADTVHVGEIPGSSANRVIPPRDRRVWGVEMGKRFRDELRAARVREGIRVDAYQFDELLSECGRSAPHREFVGGVLSGIVEGRPEFEDQPEKGFVWSAEKFTDALSKIALTGDVPRFVQDVDRAARFFVGEEYPKFVVGKAPVVGRRSAAGHKALLTKSGVRRALAQRYIVGMTPGWKLSPTTLGGNVGGMAPPALSAWRNGFIDARIAAARPRGYAQFNFVDENVKDVRLEDAVRSLHHASQQHGH